jgi:hypothetical protein
MPSLVQCSSEQTKIKSLWKTEQNALCFMRKIRSKNISAHFSTKCAHTKKAMYWFQKEAFLGMAPAVISKRLVSGVLKHISRHTVKRLSCRHRRITRTHDVKEASLPPQHRLWTSISKRIGTSFFNTKELSTYIYTRPKNPVEYSSSLCPGSFG